MKRNFVCRVLTALFVLCSSVNSKLVKKKDWKESLHYLSAENFLNLIPPIYDGITNLTCSQHFEYYLKNIDESIWAMQMFDSSTKFPESVLMGLTQHLGNFDECVGVENVHSPHGTFNGQHCLAIFSAGLDSTNHSPEKNYLGSLPKIGESRRNDHDTNGKEKTIILEQPGVKLWLAYCIPSSCSASDFQEGLNYVLKNMTLPLISQVNEEYCHTGESRQFGTEDWIAVGILIFIAVLVVSSTAYNLIFKESNREILKAFSIYSNGKKLLSTKTAGDTLQCIHGMRFITMCWVLWGHRYTLVFAVPSINTIAVGDFIEDFGRLYITNGTLSVDTFFVLSGLLLSYLFLNQMKQKTSGFNIPLFYLHRYIRLTPPYIIIILVEATILRYVETGPLLTSVMDDIADNCQKYWWTNILYVNNYVHFDDVCVAQSWYLAVDMQLFILSPLILYPLWKFPKKWNILLLGLLIIAGIVSPFTISYVEEISASLLLANQQQQNFYVATHARFGSWVIGVTFGYLIYEAKKNDMKLSTIQIIVGWILSNVALLGSLNGIYSFYQSDVEKTVLDSAFYNGLFRNVWAFGIGVTIFLCVTGYGGAANILLSWKIFPTLSRLTYCMYLTHAGYQVVQAYSLRTPIYLSDFNEWPIFFGDVIITLILAIILSLFVEAPIMNLEKHLLGKGRRTRGVNETVNVAQPSQLFEEEGHVTETMEITNAEDDDRNFTEVTIETVNGGSLQELIKEQRTKV